MFFAAVEEEGEVDGEVEIYMDAAVDAEAEADAVAVEFVSALEPHSPQNI